MARHLLHKWGFILSIGCLVALLTGLLAEGLFSFHFFEGYLGTFFFYSVLFALISHLARLRTMPGNCSACGYGLTGNASGVCPECGRDTADKGRPEASTSETHA